MKLRTILLCIVFISISSPVHGANQLPDTGLTTCYDEAGNTIAPCPSYAEAYHGQDAQYTGPEMVYHVIQTGQGDMVQDITTGLVWMQNDDGTYRNQANSITYCADLDYGGHDDWRLPDVRELGSIVHFEEEGPGVPALDPVFDATLTYMGSSLSHWTSSAAQISGYGFNFNTESGLQNYETTNRPGFARCVRGTAMDTPSYQAAGSGAVEETASGLIWQQADDGTWRTWGEALAYCEALDLGSSQSWRLPNARELRNLLDFTKSSGGYLNAAFTANGTYPYYWTSTTSVTQGDTGQAVMVYFDYGNSPMNVNKSQTGQVRCVRGGTADVAAPVATLTSGPGDLTVGGTDVSHYRAAFDGGVAGGKTAVAVPLAVPAGAQSVKVWGFTANGLVQSTPTEQALATASPADIAPVCLLLLL